MEHEQGLTRDGALLFLSRAVRMFAFGTTGVVLALYLHEVGFSDSQMGLLLYMTLMGDAGISLVVTVYADGFGRRRTLLLGCLLKLLGAAVMALVHGPQFGLLALGMTVGVISPSGNEVGPFLALEQSMLSDQVAPAARTVMFAWYNFLGSCASACGALAAGFATTALVEQYGLLELDSYRLVFVQYAALAVLLMLLAGMLSKDVECVNKRGSSREDDDDEAALSPFLSRTARAESVNRTSSQDDHELLTRPLLLTMSDEEAQGGDSSSSSISGRFGERERPHDVPSSSWLSPPPHLTHHDTPAAAACSLINGGASLPSQAASLLMPTATAAVPAGPPLQGSHISHTSISQPSEFPAVLVETPGASSAEATAAVDRGTRHVESSRGYGELHSVEGISVWSSFTDSDGHQKVVFPAATGGEESAAARGVAAVRGAAGGGAGAFQFLGLSPRSLRTVAHLSLLFAADSFGSAMITGTLLAYYFQATYDLPTSKLGGILFGANVIGGLSSLASGWVANRFGLVNTMVFTHLPSNVFLLLVPLMPTLNLAILMVFLRFSISQMDVVPRQSYVSGIVPAEERTATMGITNIVRSLGAACGPLVVGFLSAGGHFGWAFFLSGGVQIVYDLLLLWSFSSLKADHEQKL